LRKNLSKNNNNYWEKFKVITTTNIEKKAYGSDENVVGTTTTSFEKN
jgi:hypothetical protein